MLTKQQKQKIVEELADKFKRQKITVFSDFQGVSVSKLHALRRTLKKNGSEYKVAKKTIFDRALESANIELKTKKLHGEIGAMFNYNDDMAAIKMLIKFGKGNETFKILGGIFGNRILSEKDIIMLAKLPSRETLLAQLLWTLQSPIRGLVTTLQGNLKNLVVVFNKIKDKRLATSG